MGEGLGPAMVDGETVVAVRHSPFHQLIVTEDARGLRTLRFGFDGVKQSTVKLGFPEHLELAYTRVLPAGLAFVREPRHVLVIGLGAGTLPSYLHARFPTLAVDVAELNPGVLEVAREFCGFREDDRLRVAIGDGRDFLEAGGAEYDAIVLDCYGAEDIPTHLATLRFLEIVRAALRPGGAVIANIWGRESNRRYDDMLATYRAGFESVYLLDVPGPRTKVFVALPRLEAWTPATLLAAAARHFGPHGISREITEALTGVREAATERGRLGTILRD